MSWFYDGEPKKIHKKFICVYDADVQQEVWVEWNMNERYPKINRWNDEANSLWWMEWDVEVANARQADEIPSKSPWLGCSHSTNYIPPV